MSYYSDRLFKFANEGDYISLSALDHVKDTFYNNFRRPHTVASGEKTYLLPDISDYISIATYKSKSRKADNVSNMAGFVFDFDEGLADKSASDLVQEFISRFGEPTWKTQTTPSKGKWQLVYLFNQPETRFELWRRVHKVLTFEAKSDKSLGGDLARVFRVPGTSNGKPGLNNEVSIFENVGEEYSMDYFLVKLEEFQIDLPELNEPKAKKSKSINTFNKTIVNEKSDWFSEYEKQLAKHDNNPSDSRCAFIHSLVWKKKLPDPAIRRICDDLNFPASDTEALIHKIRNNDWTWSQPGKQKK